MIHLQLHGLLLVSNKTYTPVTNDSSPAIPDLPPPPQRLSHLWLMMWELRNPLLPATYWLLELGAQEDEEPGGALGASPQDASSELGQRWGGGPSSCPGLPNPLHHCSWQTGGPQGEGRSLLTAAIRLRRRERELEKRYLV